MTTNDATIRDSRSIRADANTELFNFSFYLYYSHYISPLPHKGLGEIY